MTDYIGKIIHGDSLEVMKELPDNSIDLVLTDPPYGININSNAKAIGTSTENSRKPTKLEWDRFIPTKQYFNEIKRVSKNQIIFGANYYWENFYSSQCYIVWDKRGNLPNVPFCDTEFAWTSFKDKISKKYTCINHGFVKDSREEIIHPTQKPEKLWLLILNDFSKENDLILDCFSGSGTTAIACHRMKRRFICIEKEEKYVELSRKRLKDEQSQMTLQI